MNMKLSAHKSALTRAQNTGDPFKVFVACERAFRQWDDEGYPDCWTIWQNAQCDAHAAIVARVRFGDDFA
jgi:hypothetical protein